MAIEGEFPKSDGDILFASEINTVYDKGLILSDDAGPYTHNTTTPTLKVTHVIGAGEVSGEIDIVIDKLHKLHFRSDSPSNGANKYYVRIDIGEGGSETEKRLFYDYYTSYISATVELDVTNIFTYTPTQAEKENGFNVKVYIYVEQFGTNGVNVSYSSIGRTFVRNI